MQSRKLSTGVTNVIKDAAVLPACRALSCVQNPHYPKQVFSV